MKGDRGTFLVLYTAVGVGPQTGAVLPNVWVPDVEVGAVDAGSSNDVLACVSFVD